MTPILLISPNSSGIKWKIHCREVGAAVLLVEQTPTLASVWTVIVARFEIFLYETWLGVRFRGSWEVFTRISFDCVFFYIIHTQSKHENHCLLPWRPALWFNFPFGYRKMWDIRSVTNMHLFECFHTLFLQSCDFIYDPKDRNLIQMYPAPSKLAKLSLSARTCQLKCASCLRRMPCLKNFYGKRVSDVTFSRKLNENLHDIAR